LVCNQTRLQYRLTCNTDLKRLPSKVCRQSTKNKRVSVVIARQRRKHRAGREPARPKKSPMANRAARKTGPGHHDWKYQKTEMGQGRRE